MVYPGICREGLPAEKTERAVRVKVYDEMISFEDCVMGRYSQILSSSCGDFVVQRADGPFAYHLAVVVDDAESGRQPGGAGQRPPFLDAAPDLPAEGARLSGSRLQPPPARYESDGAKLSKRDNAVSLAAGRTLRGGRGTSFSPR